MIVPSLRSLLALLVVAVSIIATISNNDGALAKQMFGRLKFPTPTRSVRSASNEYRIEWFTQNLDHFNMESQPQSYQQRYLISDKHWAGVAEDGTCKGPIIFYTGNEGDITLFWENTGFAHYLAEQFDALEVFAEHRYYGASLPFGDKSFEKQNVGYLSSEQALADYAVLITALKKQYKAENCAVIAIGGSYGGMLTAWFRLKYPNIVDGGIAASAPIFQFEGTGVSQWVFNEIITQDFAQAAPGCDDAYRNAMMLIANKYSNTQQGRDYLNSIFKLCSPLETATDAATFLGWLEGGIGYQAMADYPYPANFLEPMPGFPVNISCQRILSDPSRDPIVSFADAMAVYYNWTGTVECYNITEQATSALGNQAWDYMACTEMVFPISSNGTSDFFPPAYYDLESLTEYCQKTWGVTPRPHWIPTYYGATPEELSAGSNIVFSNGRLDPWRGGGVQETISDSLVAIIIEHGAHHLDIRAPNPLDPESVIKAREIEMQHIARWIQEKADKVAAAKHSKASSSSASANTKVLLSSQKSGGKSITTKIRNV